jgi:hypothetical protein
MSANRCAASCASAPRVRFATALRQQEREAAAPDRHRRERLREQRRGIRPVQVVEHEQERRPCRDPTQERPDALERAEPVLRPVEGVDALDIRQSLAYGGHHLGDVRGARAEVRAQRRRVARIDVGAQRLGPGPVRGGTLLLGTPSPEDAVRGQARARDQLLGRAGLTDAGVTDERHETSVAGERVVERRAKRPDLLLATDERAADGRQIRAAVK